MTLQQPETAPTGKLAELLALEVRLDARLAATRAAAEQRVAEARRRAETLLGGVAVELEAMAVEFGVRRTAALERRRGELEAETTAALARFESLTAADVARFAEELVAEVIDPAPVAP